MAPAATPAAPVASVTDALSEPAQQLVRDIAGVAPVYSSFEFSLRLPDYLARYWEQRRAQLASDEQGHLLQDYVAVLGRARDAIEEQDEPEESLDGGDAGAHADASERSVDGLLERFREIADELDGDKLSYFAPGLRRAELQLLQAVHDLCLALIYYKLTVRMARPADRLVMLTSSTGAQGCLEQSRNRFAGVEVPAAIHSFARLLELKLRLEEENCRGLLGG